MRTRGSRNSTTPAKQGVQSPPKSSGTAVAEDVSIPCAANGSKDPTIKQSVSEVKRDFPNSAVDETKAIHAVPDSREEKLELNVNPSEVEEPGKVGNLEVKTIDATEAESAPASSDALRFKMASENASSALQTFEDTENANSMKGLANASANLERDPEDALVLKETTTDSKVEHSEIVLSIDSDNNVLGAITERGDGTQLKFVEGASEPSIMTVPEFSSAETHGLTIGENISDGKVQDTEEERALDTPCLSRSISSQGVPIVEDIAEAHQQIHKGNFAKEQMEAMSSESSLNVETQEAPSTGERLTGKKETDQRLEELEEHRAVPVSDRHKEKKLEVFVGGLAKEATEEDIRNVFQKVGDITEIRLLINPHTGKNKGYAFVRYATAAQAKRAVEELEHVQIRGRTCGVLPSEENDVLFLGNLSKDWTKEMVLESLIKYEIEALEEVTLMEDPQHEGKNRGFAFLEFNTHKDALKAFKRLQKPDAVFGTEKPAKVSWAQSLDEPDEEVMAQVKSVFVDGMLPTWDEEQVKERFGKYGDIEQVLLARNMSSAKRKDFGFISYASRDAALACIEELNNTEITEGEKKLKLKVMLAKPQSKTRPVKGRGRGGHPGHETGRGRGGGLGRVAGQSGRGFSRGGSRDTYFSSRGARDYSARASSLEQLFQAVKERAYEEERQLAAQRSSLWGRDKTALPTYRESFYTSREAASQYASSFGRNFRAQGAGRFGHPRVSADFASPLHEYNVAAPASKRPYSAVDDGNQFTDRRTRARLEPSEPSNFGAIGNSRRPIQPLYDRAPVGRAQVGGNVGLGPASFTSISSLEETRQNIRRGGNTAYNYGGHTYERDYAAGSTIPRDSTDQQARRQGPIGADPGFYH